jgi:AAA ATPase domain
MDPVRNPYSPGAGSRPPALVGRDREIDAMDVALQRLLLGRDARSQLLIGLRGVGKTVLLNEFELLAGGRGFFHEHLEVDEKGVLASGLVATFRRVLLAMDAKRRIGERVRRALGILKAFSLRFGPSGMEMTIDVDPIPGPADSGELAMDLAALFVEIAELARDHDTGVLITIDELHYVDRPTLTALIVGLHRTAQLRLPITIAGAGLPSLPLVAGEAKTYAERMFMFSRIESLSPDLAMEALTTPSADEGVTWEPAALDRIVNFTQGYPYFVQAFGKVAWDVADGLELITLDDVERSLPVATAELDDGFYRVRAERANDTERSYLRAMAELEPGPIKSADVARLLGRTTNALAPARDQLIKRALCYSPRLGEIDFTVPLFGEFMKRWLPPPAAASRARGDRPRSRR